MRHHRHNCRKPGFAVLAAYLMLLCCNPDALAPCHFCDPPSCCTADCMAMPHLAVIAISGVTAIVFIAAHGILAIAELTPNPLSKKWLAVAHSEVELKTWVFKTAIVVAANVLVGNGQVQSIIILIAAGWIVYVHIRYVSSPTRAAASCLSSERGRRRGQGPHARNQPVGGVTPGYMPCSRSDLEYPGRADLTSRVSHCHGGGDEIFRI